MAIEDTIYRVDSALEKLSGGLQGLTETMQALVASVEKIVKPAQEATAKIGDLGNSLTQATGKMIAFGAAIYGIAQAGLAGTTEGNKLSYVWTLFSRQVASLFLPAIDFIINGLIRLTEWMRNLSGENQSLIMSIGLAGIAFKSLMPLLGMLQAVFSPMAIAVAVLAETLIQFFTGTTEGQMMLSAIMAVAGAALAVFADVFKIVVDALVTAFQFMYRAFVQVAIWIGGLVETILDWIPGMGEATEAVKKWRENAEANLLAMENKGFGADSKVNKDKKRSDVNPSGFNFESLSASFERITSDANKKDLTLDIAKQQLKQQEKIAEGIDKIAQNGWGDTSGGGGDF